MLYLTIKVYSISSVNKFSMRPTNQFYLLISECQSCALWLTQICPARLRVSPLKSLHTHNTAQFLHICRVHRDSFSISTWQRWEQRTHHPRKIGNPFSFHLWCDIIAFLIWFFVSDWSISWVSYQFREFCRINSVGSYFREMELESY